MPRFFLLLLAALLSGRSTQGSSNEQPVVQVQVPKQETDWFKRVIDITTLLIISAGLYFAYDQAEKIRESIELNSKSINMSTFATITTQTTEIDKVLIDNHKLQKYFFNNVDITAADADYEKTLTIATLMLDYFDSVAAFISYLEPGRSDGIIEREPWYHYIASTFKSSPILCKLYKENIESYGGAIREIAPTECKK